MTILSGIAAPNTITVVGKATVSSAPDEGAVTLTVEADGTEPGPAMNANSAAVKKVMARLRAEGVEDAAIETTHVCRCIRCAPTIRRRARSA